MAVEIVMPRLSDSMEEGTILQWLVAEGAAVAEGEPLVEVETDKASVTYESEHDGTLLSIRAQAGESVAVGAVLAVVGEPGEAAEAAGGPGASAAAPVDAPVDAASPPGIEAEPEPATASPASAESSPVPLLPVAATGAGAGGAAGPPAAGGRVKASPLARRIAAQLGVDLAGLVGTGPQGRVIRSDVERSAAGAGTGNRGAGRPGNGGGAGRPGNGGGAAPPAASTPATPAVPASRPPAAGSARGEATRTQLTRLQQTVARRMAESRATVPDFELRAEVDMSAVVDMREQLRAVTDRPPSFNDFIVKATALALREFPRVNGSYRDGAFESYSRINVGIAVAAEDALVVPTIFDADTKTLGAISAAARDLAAKVRDASITPAELAGGTFSISNLGMFGVDSVAAVVNAPQAAILGVGSLRRRAVVDESDPNHPQLVARPTVNLTLACDHRILYGADGARFLSRVRELLEHPAALAL